MGRKSLVKLAVMAALATASAAVAGPVLVVDLQVDTGNSAASGTPSGVHAITNPTVGQVVTLDVWGIIQDNASYSGAMGAPTAGDGVTGAAVRLYAAEGSNGPTGNFAGATKTSPFAFGSTGLTHVAYDNVGGSDWGGVYPNTGTSTTGYYAPLNTTPVAFNTGTTVLLGTVQWTVTSAPDGGSTLLQVDPFLNGSTGRSNYNFRIGGTSYSQGTDPASAVPTVLDANQRVKAGVGVTVGAVPEPASLGLLALGGLALLARRRKA